MAQKKPSQRRKLAELLAGPVSKKEMTIEAALLESGYSPLQAKKGLAAVPDCVLRMLGRNAKKLIKLGEVDPKTQEKIVRGRLMKNTLEGKDAGTLSAYRLGQDKRVNMWQPETQNNVLILQAPNHVDIDKMMQEKD